MNLVHTFSESVESSAPAKAGDSIHSDSSAVPFVETSDLMKQDKHCKLLTWCDSCTYCVFFEVITQKKGVSPALKGIKIKPVNCFSFVNHLCCVPSVESVHNVVQNLPVGGRLENVWQVWASKGASSRI